MTPLEIWLSILLGMSVLAALGLGLALWIACRFANDMIGRLGK
jgi:hypothetical protein